MKWKTALFVFFVLFPALIVSRQKQEVPRFQVAVNLVTLDVVVLDKNGNCPKNLRAADFEIFENGVSQQIRDFELIFQPPVTPGAPALVQRSAAASPSAPQAEQLSAGFERPKAGRSGPRDSRLFLLVFDDLNSSWENLIRMKSSIETFISENVKPDDMMAVMKAGHSIRLLQTFTNDRGALVAATRKALGMSFEGDISEADKSAARESALRMANEAAAGGAEAADEAFRAHLQMVALYSQLNDDNAQSTLLTIKALCERLAPLKGRKTMVLVSEGFAVTTPVSSIMTKMVGAANKANISIYCLNPRGLSVRDLVRAEYNENSPTVTLTPGSLGGDRTRVAGGNKLLRSVSARATCKRQRRRVGRDRAEDRRPGCPLDERLPAGA